MIKHELSKILLKLNEGHIDIKTVMLTCKNKDGKILGTSYRVLLFSAQILADLEFVDLCTGDYTFKKVKTSDIVELKMEHY